jgi:hypothetical protein
MPFKLMPALLKCDLVSLHLGRDFARTFDRLFGGRLVAFSSSILTPPFERRFAGISVFFGFGVLARTPF